MNSTMYTVTYDQIIPKFSISEEVATLGLSIFVVGLAVGESFALISVLRVNRMD